jgi:hypothetical protein
MSRVPFSLERETRSLVYLVVENSVLGILSRRPVELAHTGRMKKAADDLTVLLLLMVEAYSPHGSAAGRAKSCTVSSPNNRSDCRAAVHEPERPTVHHPTPARSPGRRHHQWYEQQKHVTGHPARSEE